MSEINWKPQKSSTVLLHRQIKEYIKRRITAGEWTVGYRLPSQRALAVQFQVNRSTVVTALEELVADGLIETKTGSGTKVANNTWNILASDPPDPGTMYDEMDQNHFRTSYSYASKEELERGLPQLSELIQGCQKV